jgi:two-component system sensor histidine kinase AlgZ
MNVVTSAERSTPSLSALWSSRALIGCVLLGEGLAAVLALGSDRPSWVFFGLASLGLQWILLLALAALYLFRGRLSGLDSGWIATSALLALIVSTGFVLAFAASLLPSLGESVPGGWLGLAARTLAVVVLVGGLAAAAFRNYWEARRHAVRAKQAELDMLHARIRPHFLFNTLNTATALVHSRPEEAERILLDLSDLFRAALGKAAQIPLAEELALTRRYLEIESSRFGDRLRIDWRIPDPLPAIVVPPLSIQPLVENAVRHGIEPSIDGGTVSVCAQITRDGVRLEIGNPVAVSSATGHRGHGVGLRASTARIEDATGGGGRVTLMRDGDRIITRVELPAPDSAQLR